MTRETLILGQINDGIEPTFPGTDVLRTSLYCNAFGGLEMDRRMRDILDDNWWVHQGDASQGDPTTGIAIDMRLPFTIDMAGWVRLLEARPTTKEVDDLAAWARVRYLGTRTTFISAHRPPLMKTDRRPEFDDNLAKFVSNERNQGQLIACFIDANEPNSINLRSKTGLDWYAPFASSICGMLYSPRIGHLATTALLKNGEHAPVISMVKVPLS